MKTHSQKFLQQRKFFTVLPVLVIPFLTLFFWALGGGKGIAAETSHKFGTGLNLELPKAYFKEEDENWNKFALYEKAKKDSLKFLQAQKNDPYYQVDHMVNNDKPDNLNLNSSLDKTKNNIDPNEEKVNRKLEQLYTELEKQPANLVKDTEVDFQSSVTRGNEFVSDIDRLEQMMQMMQESGGEDPEMKKIEDILEKILDIQHPERVKQKLNERHLQPKEGVFQVKTVSDNNDISSFSENHNNSSSGMSRNGFYGLEQDYDNDPNIGNTIEAVVHDTQELVRGAMVKMRLLNDVHINGQIVPKGQLIYGTCLINNERLNISIESIRSGNSLLPVSLDVYDMDGLKGIYIPGAVVDEMSKATTDQVLQDLDFYSYDPSLATQATNAGLQAAKNLLTKKTKAIKVTVNAGYKILLKDSRTQSLYH